MRSPIDQLAAITRTVDVALPEGELIRQLELGRPLRVKLGIDPTAPDVTLGWAVVFDLLRRFQEEGHTAVLILGDFTAQVGDPSGKSKTRTQLSDSEVNAYVDACLPMVKSLLLEDHLEIRRNSEWLGPMDMADVLRMTAGVTVSRLMDREDFSNRWKENEPISLIEFMYPLLQATDSVAVEADIEIGGTDQLLNLLMGRVLQERAGQEPQSVLTVPLLVGTDGTAKMSQSLGNYISIQDEGPDMFGKTMSIPDDAMPQWFRLAAGASAEEVESISAGLTDGSLHPGEAKRDLARRVTEKYWGVGAGEEAEAAFDALFKERSVPTDVVEHTLEGTDDEVWLPGLLASAELVSSNSEGRRMIKQGAVKLDGDRIEGESVLRSDVMGSVLQVGKRRFVRIV
ncbi:MAG: tyrosine--tRNA ligase [Acidimicrobiia bacterium]